MTDHYATLGVPRDAPADVIVRAWREAASIHHPDKGGDAEKFRAARIAYATLMNRELRAAHDKEIAAPQKASSVTISNSDFVEMSLAPYAGKWAEDPAACPICDGAREVRLAQDGFWIRKKCPACTSKE